MLSREEVTVIRQLAINGEPDFAHPDVETLCDMALAYLDLQEKMKEVGDVEAVAEKILRIDMADSPEGILERICSLITAFTASQLLLKGEGEIEKAYREGYSDACADKGSHYTEDMAWDESDSKASIAKILVSGSAPESACTACGPSPGASVNSDGGSVSCIAEGMKIPLVGGRMIHVVEQCPDKCERTGQTQWLVVGIRSWSRNGETVSQDILDTLVAAGAK